MGGLVRQTVAEFLLKGEDADLLPEAPQGDVQGAETLGGAEEAFEAGLQEVQFFQEGLEMGQVLDTALLGQPVGEMPGMAEKGRRAEAMPGGQGVQRHPG